MIVQFTIDTSERREGSPSDIVVGTFASWFPDSSPWRILNAFKLPSGNWRATFSCQAESLSEALQSFPLAGLVVEVNCPEQVSSLPEKRKGGGRKKVDGA